MAARMIWAITETFFIGCIGIALYALVSDVMRNWSEIKRVFKGDNYE